MKYLVNFCLNMDLPALFDYHDYRSYLESRLSTEVAGRGAKARLATHLNCQPSFVSQVLKNKSSFSLEQAFKINSFLNHNPLEKDFFINLVELDRAGTRELAEYFENRKSDLQEKSKLVENQMDFEQLSEADTIAYYNNFNNILIRNLIEIPNFKKVENLQKRLNLSKSEFEACLDFMLSKGLVKYDAKGGLEQGQTRLHIKKESPLAHYANIKARVHVIKNYDYRKPEDLNYGVYTAIPRARFLEFKKKFVALLVELGESSEEDPPPEMVASLVVDFMEI